MKSLLLLSLLVSGATFASTTKTTKDAKKATATQALSLKEIAEKAQSTDSLLDQDDAKAAANVSVNNSGRLNNKDEALKLSAENAKTTTTKK